MEVNEVNDVKDRTNNSDISGEYIAGFADGEGCFALKFRKDQQRNRDGTFREYFYWGAEFAIVLRADDIEILQSIQRTLSCGTISKSTKSESVRFSVQNPKDLLEKIVPFFSKYQLRGKKRRDFELWTEAVTILYKHRSSVINAQKGVKGFIKKFVPEKDSRQLKYIRSQMLNYKSHRTRAFKWGEWLKD
ncbi:MAG: LAGLIDADG family homing endonuclease [Candidatus Doudnabacteria bacterium]|nr:LAGLIDADG family homing endonuclease [Candidatus Doudnabacteria bacterium]